jgi:membrane-associated phospholipid phosphatase
LTALFLLLAGVALVFLTGADQAAQQWSQSWRDHPLARGWASFAYWAGLGGLQVGLLALLSAWAWLRFKDFRLPLTLTGMAAIGVSGLLVQVVKHLVGRPRPRLALSANEYFGPTFQSDLLAFPSGHATTSFALAAVLSVWYPRGAWLFYLLATLIALGRVVGNAHHLSDVLAGAVLGLAVGWTLATLVVRRQRRRP